MANRQLPGIFAYPVGIGDVLTGIFAPIVAFLYARNRQGARGLVIGWNIFGFLDLITAITIGRLASEVLNLTPSTAIVSLGLLFHIFSLYSLRRASASVRGQVRPEFG